MEENDTKDPRPSPEALAIRAVAGDARALQALVQALTGPTFRLALRMLGDVPSAEDATQEILTIALTKLASFEGRGSILGWTHRIGVRHILGMKRSRAETSALDLASFAEMLDAGMAYGRTAAEPSPEERTLVNEVRLTCTQGMLLVLDREDRLAIVLVDILGYDAADAAELADTTHDALRQRLARARSKLGTFLRSHCGVADSSAACTCAGQIPAKIAVGRTGRRLEPLSVGDLPPRRVALAGEELRSATAIHAAFAPGGALAAPPGLIDRLRAAMPTVLGGSGD